MTTFPEWIVPMAATLTQSRFTGPEWLFERKFDGIRLLAFKRAGDVHLFSRNRLTQALPPIARAIADLPPGELILDGELTWERAGAPGATYHLFDVVWIDGRDLRSLPLDDRRSVLRSLPLRAPLRPVDTLDDEKPWERACAEGWEGVIAKRRDSRYEQRRSPHWLKMKCELRQEFVVGGFTEPQGARVGLGALLVGFREGTELVFAGKIGTGFDKRMLLDLRARLDAIEVARAPFTAGTGLPRLRTRWVQPLLVVEVAFTEWTVHRKLRHPRLLAVRDGVQSPGG